MNDTPKKIADWQDAANRISELLFPAHVMPCFFFDGEQAQERVEASGGRAMSDAIHALYGTSLVQELEDSLRTYLNSQRSTVRRDVGDVREDELASKRKQRDDLEVTLAEAGKRLLKVRKDLEVVERGRRERLHDLTQITGDAVVDIQQISKRKSDLERREQELREQLTDNLGRLALPLALRRLGPSTEEQLEAEIIRDRWTLLKEETLMKVDVITYKALPAPSDATISPPLTPTQHGQLLTRLRGALEALWSPPPAGCAEAYRFHFLGASDRQATLKRFKTLAATAVADVGALASEWQQAKLRCSEVQKQWDQIRDLAPRIEEIKGHLTELDEKVMDLNSQKGNLERQASGISGELKDLAAAIGQMENLQRKLGPVEQKLDVAERVREVIRDLRDKLVPLCKDSLAASCTKHFRQMISSEYKHHRVEFDHDLQPILLGERNEPIYISTLSGAQKRAFGLAFTLAVAEVSGEGVPIVVDTPVGNMDSEYRRRILAYLATAAPGQIIFLSHDEEISPEYASGIDPFVAQRYLVKFESLDDGVGVSKVFSDQYFT